MEVAGSDMTSEGMAAVVIGDGVGPPVVDVETAAAFLVAAIGAVDTDQTAHATVKAIKAPTAVHAPHRPVVIRFRLRRADREHDWSPVEACPVRSLRPQPADGLRQTRGLGRSPRRGGGGGSPVFRARLFRTCS